MKASAWKAGVATANITPDEPMWLAGWAARREPAHGKSMDLFAKALAIEDPDGHAAVLLTADLIAIPRELATLVAARVRMRWNIPRDALLFNASHTHTGPELRPDKVPFFEIPEEFAAKIPPYLAALQEKMTSLIGAALENLQPAILRVCQTSVDFARNRRATGGPVSHDVPVLQISRDNGKLMAIAFGYACHNLTLPPTFCQYHGDYAGIAQKKLEETFPGATALFVAGAGADQDPEPRGALQLAEEHGYALARKVAQILEQPGKAIEGSLRTAFEQVPLDFLPVPSEAVLKSDLQSGDPPRARKAKYLLDSSAAHRRFPANYPCPLQVLRFGREFLLFALGGEPVADYALRLKSEFAGPVVWVAGYSNDMFGYLPTRRIQAEGGYEGGRALLWSALPAPFTDTVEERIFDSAHRLAAGLDTATTNV